MVRQHPPFDKAALEKIFIELRGCRIWCIDPSPDPGQASLELDFYLGDGGPDRLVMKSWTFDSRNLVPFARLMADEGRVEADEPVWAMSTGWYNLQPLTTAVPEEILTGSARFGQISFIHFRLAGKPPGME